MNVNEPRTAAAQMDTFRQAEHAIRRQTSDGLTFATVRKSLQWFVEARGRMATASGCHPRASRAADGSMVVVDVDGGKPTSRDEVLATLATVHAAIEDARVHYPEGVDYLIRTHTGETQSDIARVTQKSQQTISIAIGKAEAFLVGRLGAAGVLR